MSPSDNWSCCSKKGPKPRADNSYKMTSSICAARSTHSRRMRAAVRRGHANRDQRLRRRAVGLNVDSADASSRKIRMENSGDHQTSDGTRDPVHTDKIASPVVRQQQRREMLTNRDPGAVGQKPPLSTHFGASENPISTSPGMSAPASGSQDRWSRWRRARGEAHNCRRIPAWMRGGPAEIIGGAFCKPNRRTNRRD